MFAHQNDPETVGVTDGDADLVPVGVLAGYRRDGERKDLVNGSLITIYSTSRSST
jgi:hypothetical protein